jgi:hypothetical protein
MAVPEEGLGQWRFAPPDKSGLDASGHGAHDGNYALPNPTPLMHRPTGWRPWGKGVGEEGRGVDQPPPIWANP